MIINCPKHLIIVQLKYENVIVGYFFTLFISSLIYQGESFASDNLKKELLLFTFPLPPL